MSERLELIEVRIEALQYQVKFLAHEQTWLSDAIKRVEVAVTKLLEAHTVTTAKSNGNGSPTGK